MVEPDASTAELRARLLVEQRKLAAVRELGRALGVNFDHEHILTTIVFKVPELIDAERATLYILEEAQGPCGVTQELVSKVVIGGLGPPRHLQRLDEIRLRLGEGIAGTVAQSGQPINIPDAYEDPRFNPDVDRRSGFHTRSILCVPIPDHAGRLLGVLQALNRRDGAPFDGDDEALLSTMAAYVGAALENSRLYQSLIGQNAELLRTQAALKERIFELDLLYQIERESAAAMDLAELNERLCRRAVQLLPGEAAIVALRLQSGELELTYFRVSDGDGVQRVRVERGDGMLSWVLQHRQVLRSNDVRSDPRATGRVGRLLSLDVDRALAVPLLPVHGEAADNDEDGDEALGVLAVVNKQGPGGFDLADEKLLTLLGGHAARAILLERTRALRVREGHLASIGRMLAGIMHDLRTPMTIVSGYAQLMASSDDQEERERYVRMIQKQFDLMEAMTGEVMAFARGETKLLVRRVLLTRFVEEVREQLEREMPPGVSLVLRPRYLGPAYFDELKLLRLVHNLARNAIQAMPDGGTFTIGIDRRVAGEGEAKATSIDRRVAGEGEAKATSIDRRVAGEGEAKATSIDLAESGAELVFTFSDTGGGLPDEVQARLFEAFVSWRKDGGTGLGLAIVKKIVDDHRGRISVSTHRGEGTTFTVAIPLSR